MKKFLSVVLMCVLAVTMVTACGKKEEAPKNQQQKIKEVAELLKFYTRHFKQRIATELNFRFVPQISFYYDNSQEIGSRIDDLLAKAHVTKSN